ncbi:MAG: transcription antitermination factor NusB [Clostridia bacterium]
MSRKIARDYALKLVYEYLFNKEIDENTKETFFADSAINDSDMEYINKVTNGVVENYSELVMMIADNAKNFKLDRIFKFDLAGLLVGCYEMKYMDDIPLSVTINEVVELVKTYSTERSHIFVNGVLAGVYKQLTNKE